MDACSQPSTSDTAAVAGLGSASTSELSRERALVSMVALAALVRSPADVLVLGERADSASQRHLDQHSAHMSHAVPPHTHFPTHRVIARYHSPGDGLRD